MSLAINVLSNHYEFEKICYTKHPNIDPTRCALVYGTVMEHKNIDTLWQVQNELTPFNAKKVYWSFENGANGAAFFEKAVKTMCNSMLVVGIILHFLNIKIRPEILLTVFFILNILL